MHERPAMRPNEIYSNTQLRVHFGIYICAPACNSGSISRLLPRYRISKLKSRHTSPRSQIGFDGSQKPSAPFLVPRNCYRRPPGRGLDKRSSAVAVAHEVCPTPICFNPVMRFSWRACKRGLSLAYEGTSEKLLASYTCSAISISTTTTTTTTTLGSCN